MRLYRGTILDTPENPFVVGPERALRALPDGALLVDDDGIIVARGPFDELRAGHPDAEVIDAHRDLIIPGLVDTHVHFPQVRAIGGLGLPLLDWLEHRALPEEVRLGEPSYAAAVAREFVDALLSSGTTTTLTFGSHFASAMDALFAEADARGIRMTAGQVLSDRILPAPLLSTGERALAEGRRLIERWHGHGRLRYAVTPRFSLSASDDILSACRRLAESASGVWVTSHINENPAEIATVAEQFPDARDYLDTYRRHDLVGPRSVLAHNVHPTDAELQVLATTGAWVSHCPASNAALGSGLFPMRRHVEAGVNLCLGSDVGGGTGFSLIKEGLQAYFAQQLQGSDGYPLTPAHLLYLATRAGALALGLADQVGDLSVGKAFDAVWIAPRAETTMAVVVEHAADPADALARVFALATNADIARVWIAGRSVAP